MREKADGDDPFRPARLYIIQDYDRVTLMNRLAQEGTAAAKPICAEC